MAFPMVSGEEEVVQVVGKLADVLLQPCSGELRRGKVDLVGDFEPLHHGLLRKKKREREGFLCTERQEGSRGAWG
nr:unnamed protein product [Digitaria exilis]